VKIDGLIATAGQPTAAQLRHAAEASFQVVINLASDGLDTSLPEKKSPASLGLEYHHIPVAWNDPQITHLKNSKSDVVAQRPADARVHWVFRWTTPGRAS